MVIIWSLFNIFYKIKKLRVIFQSIVHIVASIQSHCLGDYRNILKREDESTLLKLFFMVQTYIFMTLISFRLIA